MRAWSRHHQVASSSGSSRVGPLPFGPKGVEGIGWPAPLPHVTFTKKASNSNSR